MFSVTYPNSGSGPTLARDNRYIGVLEPVDPTDLETDQMAWYLKHAPIDPPAGTVVRLGARTFAVIRSALIAYYHLA
jgi:hypothetical protein